MFYKNYKGKHPIELFDSKGNKVYYEVSKGVWFKLGYDEKGNLVYFEDYTKFWSSREYDENGKEVYYENSNGRIKGSSK